MTRRTLLAFGFGITALTACSASDPAGPATTTRQVSQSIINGTDSTAAQDAVVQIRIEATGPGAPPGSLCTGSLIAPNLVLTARHCVSIGKGAGFACVQDGAPADDNGASNPGTDIAATAFKFFTGVNNPADDATPRALGKKVIHDGAATLCGHDLALILLDTPINDVTPIKVRLDSGPVVGEKITAVGWGVTTTEQTPAIRKQRTGVNVDQLGPAETMPAGEFAVGESICSGDSGGPAIAESTGEVIGVVSRGGNENDNDPNNIAKGCLSPAVDNYQSTAAFKTLIQAALAEAAGGASVDVPDAGAPVGGGDGGAAAPASGDDTSGSGCATSPSESHPGSALVVALGAILLLGARRRRST